VNEQFPFATGILASGRQGMGVAIKIQKLQHRHRHGVRMELLINLSQDLVIPLDGSGDGTLFIPFPLVILVIAGRPAGIAAKPGMALDRPEFPRWLRAPQVLTHLAPAFSRHPVHGLSVCGNTIHDLV